MEAAVSSGSDISIKPDTIKAAQEEMGRLDVLVCGQCHSVFHFIDEFQEHRSKVGACSKESNFRENSNNEQKAQVWAFLLWKGTQSQQESPDKNNSSWKLYQRWCKMDTHIRDCWITAGKTIQTFTKITNAKMQDVSQGGTESGKTVVLRKIIRNGQPDSPNKKDSKMDVQMKSDTDDKGRVGLKPSIKPKVKSSDGNNESDEEYVVEQIVAKRLNPKKKMWEYLLKWKGYAYEHNTWEEATQVSLKHKHLLDDFEKNLALQKEIKEQQVAKSINKANLLGMGQKTVKTENIKAGPSTTGRPMRSSKSKAMDQVKVWCGSMKDDMFPGKRKITYTDSDSDEDGIGSGKRSKFDDSAEEEWTADSEEDKVVIGRSDVIQRAFSRATGQSNGSTNSVLSTNKNVTKIEQKNTVPQQQSNVYILHRKDGIIKLDSSPTNKITVKGTSQTATGGVLMLPNRDAGGNVLRKQIVSTSHANSITPVKVISKPDGTQVVTQMKVVPKNLPTKSGIMGASKNEPIKIQPKPDPNQVQQILVATIPSPLTVQTSTVAGQKTLPGVTRTVVQRPGDNRQLVSRSTIRNSSPATASLVSITPSRTPVRMPQRQINSPNVQQQRPMAQKRMAPTTTILQASSPTINLPSVRPKITVVNAQGKMVQKTVGTPTQPVAKPQGKTTPTAKSQTAITPQQKIMMARKKIAEEAGVVPKPVGGRAGATRTTSAAAAARAKAGAALAAGNKPKESKLAETDGLHMEFHQVDSEESSSEGEPDFPPLPPEGAQPPEPDSPPRQFTLCPLTGRLIGPDGVPVEQPEADAQPKSNEPTPIAVVPASATATINADGTITTVAEASGNTELVLPTLESIAEASGGIVRVEMSPGGTTGTIVQTNEEPSIAMPSVVVPGTSMPSLDDPSIDVQSSETVVVSVPPVAMTETTVQTTTTPTTTAMEPEAAIAAQVVVTTEAAEQLAVPTTTTTTTAGSVTAAPTEEVPTSEAAILLKPEEPSNNVEVVTAAASSTTNVKLEESGGLVTITGDDGVVYQVTGQAEDGQTLLVTRGADGEQQCVYVTTTEQQAGEEGSVLTLDHAVAEAVAQLMPDQVNLAPQFYVKDGAAAGETVETAQVATVDNQNMVMSIMDNTSTVVETATPGEDGENQAQVVAQVIQADEPTPGGTRRVVLLLPDGNLMMTEVDEEQYAALELDK